ncbi:MAG: hypothetical protein FJ291_12905 [Planctomycetes bacterium]|nr:hypothetical protein [Planctomycetota bacterium]
MPFSRPVVKRFRLKESGPCSWGPQSSSSSSSSDPLMAQSAIGLDGDDEADDAEHEWALAGKPRRGPAARLPER